MNKPNFKKVFQDFGTSVQKHSPEILTGIGIAGMVTTTVLAVRATPKALQLIEEAEKEALEENEDFKCFTKPAMVKIAWKPYIPAVVTGIFSTACLIGSNSVNARRNAALATAYKISEEALSVYKEKVIETIGEKKEKTIRDKVAEEHVANNPVSSSEVYITEKGNTLCLDTISKRYFKSDIDKLRKAENMLNKRMLGGEDYISLNEFYYEIGLDPIGVGDDIGWNVSRDGVIDLHFGSQIADDGTPCIVMDYRVAPRYDYDRV